jgi:hypothetical protein
MFANIGFQLAYFIFQKKFMHNSKIDLISWKRIVGFFVIQLGAAEPIGKLLFQDNYHVNLNELVD